MNAAVDLARKWTEEQQVAGMRLEVLESEGRTPLIYIEVDGDESSTVLMYGHLDKQPAMVGWEKGLGPWTPVLRDGKLYGRGGADDGYAIFASIAAIRAVQKQGAKHSRIVVIIECCEESGSTDLPHYIEMLAKRIGTPRLVVCLDSGCGNYEQLWLTTSLRGSIVGNLTVEVLDRRRALRRRERHRAVELSHSPHAARAARGSGERTHQARVVVGRHPAAPHQRRRRDRPHPRRRRVGQVSVGQGSASDRRRIRSSCC